MKWFQVGVLVLFATSGFTAEAMAQRRGGGPNSLEGFERRQGYVLLFDGETLDGWTNTGSADWSIDAENAAITATPGSEGLLVTDGAYSNFHLEIDFLVEEGASSVVYLRAPESEAPTAENSFAVPVVGGDAEWATGSIVGVEPASQNAVPVGEWANLDILAIGGIITIMINETTVVDIETDVAPRSASGKIALAPPADGSVQFRTMRILPL